MITLITGAPRSGKSLYTVDKLIHPEIGRQLPILDDLGETVIITRRVCSNINKLMLEHEMVDNEWLNDLPANSKPGDYIVFDEVQKVWPNRPNGSKVPPSVAFLETHGHDAIDLVIMTQNPMLLDPSVRALVGRHLHVRKVGALGGAIIYEWDGCSNSLNFKSAFTKRGYRYSKRAQKLYQSARGHTGSRAGLPFVAYLAVVGLAAAVAFWPMFLGKLTSGEFVKLDTPAPGQQQIGLDGAAPGTQATKRQMTFVTQPEQKSIVDQVGGATGEIGAPGQLGGPLQSGPVFSGCAVVRDACTCYDTSGRGHEVEAGSCESLTRPARLTATLPDAPELAQPSRAEDLDLARFVAGNRAAPFSLH